MSASRIVIVGAGQAGAMAGARLRAAGYSGELTLIGEERQLAYERPPLSKGVLLGRAQGDAALILPESFYSDKGIALQLQTRIARIDVSARTVAREDGESIPYDHLIIATGARARRLYIPGIGLPGVCYLRSVADAEALRRALLVSRRMVVIGGGFIGLEVASSARRLGVEVVVVEQAPTCLARVMPPAAVAAISSLHINEGVQIVCGRAVQAIEGDGRVERVTLDDGANIEADLVLVGVGSVANDELARAAGIACANGILVDAHCRTSADGVFAIGDVASIRNSRTGATRRLESWDNAERQAERVAAHIMQRQLERSSPPWFWSDQYDHNIQMLGLPAVEDAVHVRPGGHPDRYIQLYLRNGVLAGAVLYNSGRDRHSLARLIGYPADPVRLADPSFPLRQAAIV